MKRLLIGCTLAVICGGASAKAACPPYVQGSTGGDYTSAEDRKGLSVVESYHFTRAVETLTQGNTGSVGGDISYTLEHFPNHHRALASMARLGLRQKSAQPHGARFTVSCYFERAIAFAPHDVTARMVYGSYLLAIGQDATALEQLDAASRMAPEQATIQYNLGLMYVKKKDYEKASAHAQKAYALGFPLPGLKNKLKAAGKWKEPPPAVTDPPKAAQAEEPAVPPAVPPVEEPSGE